MTTPHNNFGSKGYVSLGGRGREKGGGIHVFLYFPSVPPTTILIVLQIYWVMRRCASNVPYQLPWSAIPRGIFQFQIPPLKPWNREWNYRIPLNITGKREVLSSTAIVNNNNSFIWQCKFVPNFPHPPPTE